VGQAVAVVQSAVVSAVGQSAVVSR
jgi:hypothetical protein